MLKFAMRWYCYLCLISIECIRVNNLPDEHSLVIQLTKISHTFDKYEIIGVPLIAYESFLILEHTGYLEYSFILLQLLIT